jgi:hypothetical protein
MDDKDLYILLSPTVVGVLAENDVNLCDVLTSAGYDAHRSYGESWNPAPVGAKDITSVIVASGAVIASLTPLLIATVSSLTRRPVTVKEWVAVPAESSSGQLVKDESGTPILYWTERYRLLEPGPSRVSKARITGPLGLSVEIDS